VASVVVILKIMKRDKGEMVRTQAEIKIQSDVDSVKAVAEAEIGSGIGW
jgi:hypothetical protein